MKHFTSRILMISPDKFRNNELTISDNSFQSRVSENISISDRAISEFERLKESISNRGVNVHAISDDSEFDTPDAVFPNNWISFHHSNRAVLYPMSALNRRFERKSSALKKLSDQGIKIDIEVGVSYSSNVETVKKALNEVAQENNEVLMMPKPEIFLTKFGDSSWDMMLRIWIPDGKRKIQVTSDLNFAIVDKFRQYHIEIPFPQRDVWFKNSNPS